MKKKIIVHDYNQVFHGQTCPYRIDKNKEIMSLEVEALCVGGDDGIFAYFFYKHLFCMAKGDDGNWTLLYTCHKSWFNTFATQAFAPLMSEIVPED